MLPRLVGLMLCATAVVQATAVVVFRTPERVIIAADSLVGQGGHERRVCKVRPAGRWWTSLSGNTAGIADVHAEIVRALAATRTLIGARDALYRHVYPQVERGLKSVRHTPDFARLYLASKNDLVAEIVVTGANEGDATLRVGVFIISMPTTDPPTFSAAWLACPGRLCDDDPGVDRLVFGAGVAGPTITYTTPPYLPWVRRADAAAARRIVAEQIAATPTKVGPPIDVLEVTASGARWVGRDPGSWCARVP